MLSNKTMLEWFKTVRDPTLRATLLRLEASCRQGSRVRCIFPRMLDALAEVYIQATDMKEDDYQLLRSLYDRWLNDRGALRRETAPFRRASINPEDMRSLKRWVLKSEKDVAIGILRDLEIDE